MYLHINLMIQSFYNVRCQYQFVRDCNPRLEFSIPVFGIVELPIPGSRDPVGIDVVKTTRIATWLTVFGSIFELQVCTIVLWI